MKKAFLVLAGLGLALAAFAQGPFICTTEGAKLVYVTTDAKGNESSQTDALPWPPSHRALSSARPKVPSSFT